MAKRRTCPVCETDSTPGGVKFFDQAMVNSHMVREHPQEFRERKQARRVKANATRNATAQRQRGMNDARLAAMVAASLPVVQRRSYIQDGQSPYMFLTTRTCLHDARIMEGSTLSTYRDLERQMAAIQVAMDETLEMAWAEGREVTADERTSVRDAGERAYDIAGVEALERTP